MDYIRYSEIENNSDCDFHSTTSKDLDFVNDWVSLTVDKEVLRGSKLREEKLRTYPTEEECAVLNVDCIKSPCYFNKTYSRLPHCSRPDTPHYKQRCYEHCPMRIAELAVPTKRQCIDTWRNKCHILPPCMLDRLKQQVMDEKPIVQISDAVTCFQRKVTKKTAKAGKRSQKQSFDKKRDEMMKELQRLCEIFGTKMAQKLITPQNIKLNPELNKISKIVADDIVNVMHKKKFDYRTNKNDKIFQEVSEKIAVWIVTILEDTSYKILQEDLKELEEQEGPVLDFLDDLLNIVLAKCAPKTDDDINIKNDLERISKSVDEQQDQSDQSLRDNDVDMVISKTEVTNDTEVKNDTNVTEKTTQKENEELKNNRDMNLLTMDRNDIDVADHLQSEISDTFINGENADTVTTSGNIDKNLALVTKSDHEYLAVENVFENASGLVSSPTAEIGDSTGEDPENDLELNEVPSDDIDDLTRIENSIDFLEHTTNQITTVNASIKLGNVSAANSSFTAEYDESSRKDKSSLVENPQTLTLESNISADRISAESNLTLKNANVSAIFEISAKKSTDEKEKLLQLSQPKMDVRGDLNEDSMVQIRDSNNSTSEIIKKNIDFAVPNQHLLSDVDESWPLDIEASIVKATSSVSKSVYSLGNIIEEEDIVLSGILPQHVSLIKLDNEPKNLNIGINIDEGRLQQQNMKHKSVTSATSQELYHQSLSYYPEISVSNRLTDGENSKEILNKIREKNIISDKSKHADTTPVLGINIDSQTDNKTKHLARDVDFYKADAKTIEQNLHSLLESKFDYRVHPNSAPLWAQYYHGKGEPSDDSFYQVKDKIKEIKIRQWCQDLDRMFSNLELWNDWLRTICKTMIYLTRNRVPRQSLIRDWKMLKKDIDEDAVLWIKLNRSAYKKLINYKKENLTMPAARVVPCVCRTKYILKKTMQDS